MAILRWDAKRLMNFSSLIKATQSGRELNDTYLEWVAGVAKSRLVPKAGGI